MVVNTETISTLASTLEKATRDIAATLDTLDSKIAVLREGWTGEASDAYAAAQQNWRSRIDTANGVLAEMTTQVSAAGPAFERAEAANRGRW